MPAVNITTTAAKAFEIPSGTWGYRMHNASDETIYTLDNAAVTVATGMPLAAGAERTVCFAERSRQPMSVQAIHAGSGNKSLRYEILTVQLQAASRTSPSGGAGSFGSLTGVPGDNTALAAALAAKLDKAGGTMTGALTTSIPALGTTPNQGITLTNTTPAALGAQQVSPWLSLIGQSWNTTSNASQPAEFAFHVLPVQGTTVTQRLLLRSRVNNGSWGTCAQFYNQQDPSGYAMTLSSFWGSVDFLIGGSGTLRTNLSSTGTGSFQIDSGGSNAVILTAKTTATLQLGVDHATTATTQTIKAHNVTTGLGANLVLAGGTGSVAGGSVSLAASVTTGAPNKLIEVFPGGQIAFFGSAGAVQVNTGIAGEMHAPGTGPNVTEDSTFGGYTLMQIIAGLRALGLFN